MSWRSLFTVWPSSRYDRRVPKWRAPSDGERNGVGPSTAIATDNAPGNAQLAAIGGEWGAPSAVQLFGRLAVLETHTL